MFWTPIQWFRQNFGPRPNLLATATLKAVVVCVLWVLQVLFLGPLLQMVLDCPWSFMDGIQVAFGESGKKSTDLWTDVLDYSNQSVIFLGCWPGQKVQGNLPVNPAIYVINRGDWNVWAASLYQSVSKVEKGIKWCWIEFQFFRSELNYFSIQWMTKYYWWIDRLSTFNFLCILVLEQK